MTQRRIFLSKVGDPSNRSSGPQFIDVFDSPSFYSQEYDGSHKEELIAFQLLVEEYNEWKRQYFLGKANTSATDEVPQSILELFAKEKQPDAKSKPTPKRNTKKGSKGGDEVGAGATGSDES